MANYMMPQRNNKNETGIIQGLGSIAGGVAGAFIGGPAGAATGASLGSQGGGMLGQMSQKDPASQPQAVQSQGLASAMQRRQSTMDTDNLSTLRRAEEAAVNLPEQDRQQVVPVLTRARIMEENKRGGY